MAEPVHKPLVVADPGIPTLEMTFDAVGGPVFEFDLEGSASGFGLEPQAVACEVHRVLAFVLGKEEALAKSAKGVRKVQFAGRLQGGKLSHAGLISH
jgi:hypothetical protein